MAQIVSTRFFHKDIKMDAVKDYFKPQFSHKVNQFENLNPLPPMLIQSSALKRLPSLFKSCDFRNTFLA